MLPYSLDPGQPQLTHETRDPGYETTTTLWNLDQNKIKNLILVNLIQNIELKVVNENKKKHFIKKTKKVISKQAKISWSESDILVSK